MTSDFNTTIDSLLPTSDQSNNRGAGDSFSLRRVGMLYAFYRPLLKRQLLIYTCATFLLGVLLLLPISDTGQLALFSMVWSIVPLMYQMSPCVFAYGPNSRIIERLIPATASEKMTFYISYLLVPVFLASYFLPSVAEAIYVHVPSICRESKATLIEIQAHTPFSLMLMNSLLALAAVFACLWAVKSCKTNRTIKGVAATLGVQIVGGIWGAIIGFSSAFQAGYEAGAEAARTGNEISDEIARDLADSTMAEMTGNIPWLIGSYVLFGGMAIFFIWQTYRAISSRNI